MAYSCKILADSINPHGNRLTTFECTYPRMVHSELMTHRLFSRNTASSRAIPVKKMLDRVMTDPVMPVYWGKNQSGMQANVELEGIELEEAKIEWLRARDYAVASATRMEALGMHKQLVNRVIEPWMWITAIVSATEYDNWFNLRCHPDAQPEIRHIAEMMRNTYNTSRPKLLLPGEWHMPLMGFEGDDKINSLEYMKLIATGRCARVSYLTHDGKRDLDADLLLASNLKNAPHLSPFEHIAESRDDSEWYGNFRGWKQFRKYVMPSNVF